MIRVPVYIHDSGVVFESPFVPAGAIRKVSADAESGLVSLQFFTAPFEFPEPGTVEADSNPVPMGQVIAELLRPFTGDGSGEIDRLVEGLVRDLPVESIFEVLSGEDPDEVAARVGSTSASELADMIPAEELADRFGLALLTGAEEEE